ncbi:uncharacterized protein LOC110458686 [Mizuhopecten yessoensis]|uniref:uncharacterized protein LOC110458686 n=1 Tax=Mizuhopecten yessoensis TaxID=6573 RepID=UPI000B45C483|nr:uncharacterized protein LOC110458686 [Mizuhopecten yessoensis]
MGISRHENQIDLVCISKKFRRSLQDVRVKRGADAASDHHLIVAKNATEKTVTMEDHWQEIKEAFTTACETSVANKEVRNSARKDKRAFVDKLAAEAEEAARANNIKALYDTIKLLTGKYQKGCRPVKSKEGKTLNTHEEQMKRWVEHFRNVLNKEPPVNKADIPPSEELLAVDCKTPSKGENKKDIKMLKNNKIPGPDNIPAEALKADIEKSTQMIYELFGKIREEGEVPLEWKEGHMQATDGRRNGIQWTMFTQLDDLDFADGIALLSHDHQQMQGKLAQVKKESCRNGPIYQLQKYQSFKVKHKDPSKSDG